MKHVGKTVEWHFNPEKNVGLRGFVTFNYLKYLKVLKLSHILYF